MRQNGFIHIIKRELAILASRRVYLFGMVIVPVAVALFFVSLLSEGLPLKVPTAVVDLDNTSLSRSVVRNLNSQELTDITMSCSSYNEAISKVRSGEIFGFFYIPLNFEQEAMAGLSPTITYYSNLTYYVPGSLAFKGFKTMAVTTSGSLAGSKVVSAGLGEGLANVLLQPVVIDINPLKNPWTNYSIYLSNSFIPAALELMIFLVTVFSICSEIKRGDSRMLLEGANGSVVVAILGKLLPQTFIFIAVGLGMEALLFGYCHFPLNGSTWGMVAAMILFVIACQSFALFVTSVLPNMRLALSICSLSGILAFSVAGFSFPVEHMYGPIGIFSYLLPVRYYFLIYIDQALNGIDLYFSRFYYVALLLFPLGAMAMLWNLKRALRDPVYVP